MIDVNNSCTGCGACSMACPANCVKMTENRFGFIYPSIDDKKCISCGKCERVCHLYCENNDEDFPLEFYAVVSNSNEILEKSTSGGAFSALANAVLEASGTVYGCSYVNHLQAEHIRITEKKEIAKLNGSKYVQSVSDKVFDLVKKDLQSGKLVLFSGTPCQISALKSFLDCDLERLITVDIVCHGVSSQWYFNKYIEWFEQKHSCLLSNYDFRSKKTKGWSLAGMCEGENSLTGKPFKKKVFYFNEYYYFQFLRGLTYRESCYECKYANLNRVGDITLGDMWGAEKLDLDFDTSLGCSLVIVNTDKGKKLFDKIDIKKKRIAMDEAVKLNMQLTKPSEKPIEYEKIMEFCVNNEASIIDKSFRKKYRRARIVGYAKYHIPSSMRRIILRHKK